MNRNTTIGTFLLATLLLLGSAGLAYMAGGGERTQIEQAGAQILITLPTADKRLPIIKALPLARQIIPDYPIRDEAIPDVVINARAAYAVTNKGEVLFAQNESEVLPIASITKLLTALTAIERIGADGSVTVTSSAIKTEGDLGRLVVGETFSLKDAFVAMLLPSSNDAAVAIAEAGGGVTEFVKAMQEKAISLGIEGADFNNVHGLAPPGNYASARGVVVLLNATLLEPILVDTIGQSALTVESEEGIVHTFVHTGNGLIKFPGALGLKTGYTDESLGTLAFAFRPDSNSDRTVYTVILGSNNRASDTIALARWARGAYSWPPKTNPATDLSE